MNQLRQVRKYTTEATRKIYVNSFVISKLRYLSATYVNIPDYLAKKLDKLLADAAKLVLSENTYRKSYDYLIDKCGWKRICIMAQHECLKLMHAINIDKRPLSLATNFSFPSRACKNISVKSGLTNKDYSNVFLFNILHMYNNIKAEIKTLPIKRFNKRVKKL